MKSLIYVVFVWFLAVASRGAFAVDPQPLLAAPSRLMFEDNFEHSVLSSNWKVGKGQFEIKDGVLSVEETPTDNHAAFATINPSAAYKDAIIEFSFKIGVGARLHLVVRDRDYRESHAGNIAQTVLSPSLVYLSDIKLGTLEMEKLKSKSETRDPQNTIEKKSAPTSAQFKISLDPSLWRQARIEIAGDEMLLCIEGKPAGYLKSEGIDHATKNIFVFIVNGKCVQVRNLRVWQAAPVPGWVGRRQEVLDSLMRK